MPRAPENTHQQRALRSPCAHPLRHADHLGERAFRYFLAQEALQILHAQRAKLGKCAEHLFKIPF